MSIKLLSLDLSTSCSGWSVFDDGKLVEYGNIPEPCYKGKSKEKYPQRSGRVGKLMAEAIESLVIKLNPDIIIIEEASANGIAGVKSIKGLIQLHGMVLYLLSSLKIYDTIVMISPREWRGAVGLKKNGDWKQSSVNLTNKLFGLNLTLTENDISDSILLGLGYLKLGGNVV